MHQPKPPRYPLLEQLFAARPERLEALLKEGTSTRVFAQAEQLVGESTRLSVVGADKLTNAGSIKQLRAELSELRIANLFVRLGFGVEVLADQAFGPSHYAPDLLVSRAGLELHVECARDLTAALTSGPRWTARCRSVGCLSVSSATGDSA